MVEEGVLDSGRGVEISLDAVLPKAVPTLFAQRQRAWQPDT